MIGGPFAREAPLELLRDAAPLQRRIWAEVDAFISIWSPENTREGSELSEERQVALQQMSAPMRERTMAMEVPWVIAEYPVLSTAQEAGMTLPSSRSSSSSPCCSTGTPRPSAWRASPTSSTRPTRCASSAPGTDLTLSLAGRHGAVDDGHVNMPGGEVFYSPVEDSAEGVVEFREFPAVYYGHEVVGVRFVFERGRIVDASASQRRGVPAARRSTPTTARGGSASSASAATRASSAS